MVDLSIAMLVHQRVHGKYHGCKHVCRPSGIFSEGLPSKLLMKSITESCQAKQPSKITHCPEMLKMYKIL